MEIFKLFGSILVDSSEANKSISKTSKEAEGLGTKLKAGIKAASEWATAVVAGATAVGGAMVAAAKDTASQMDVIDKASQRMKIGAESYQELAHAASLSGVEMTVLEKAAKKLEGTDINMDEALAQIYELGTAEERSAKAAELFGETVAYQMTPLLNASAEDMANMKQEAHDLGLVMGEETVKNGATLNDMFSNVEDSLKSLKNSLLSEFMPYVIEILQFVMENIPLMKEAIQNVLDFIMPYIKPILDSVMTLIKSVFELLSGDTEAFCEDIKKALKGLGTALFQIGKDIFTSLWDGAKEIWGKISDWVTEKVNWIASKFSWFRTATEEMARNEGGYADGSHASGLNYVPYDGYVAELHRGESVLNAGLVDRLVEKLDNIGSSGSNAPIELTMNIDGKQFARATWKNYQDEGRRRGGSLVTQ